MFRSESFYFAWEGASSPLGPYRHLLVLTAKGTEELSKPYEYVIDLWQTANYFPAGHRVRLEISSSNFPRFARNLNTGGDQALEVIPEVARQRVYHNAFYPSRLEVTAAGFPRGGEAPAGAEEEFDEEEPEPPPLAAPEDSNP